MTKGKNGENLPHLEITAVVLIPCNIVSNDYQQDSRVLYTFVPTKLLGQLLDIPHKKNNYGLMILPKKLYMVYWSSF